MQSKYPLTHRRLPAFFWQATEIGIRFYPSELRSRETAPQSWLVPAPRVNSSKPHIFWYWWRLCNLGSRTPCIYCLWLNATLHVSLELAPSAPLQSRHRSVGQTPRPAYILVLLQLLFFARSVAGDDGPPASPTSISISLTKTFLK